MMIKKIVFRITMGQSYTLNDFPESHRPFVGDCSHQGQCDDDVSFWVEYFSVNNKKKLREYLKNFGAWDSKELADDDANLNRLIWTMANDIKENGEAHTCQ